MVIHVKRKKAYTWKMPNDDKKKEKNLASRIRYTFNVAS
jgi:hypothetical protein